MTTAIALHSRPEPTSATRVRLGDLLTVIRGVTYKKEDSRYEPGPGLLPVLRATNIQAGLDFEGLVYVPQRNVSADQRLRKGDIVIAASSGSLSVVGKAARLHHDWEGSFGAFCFGLRANANVDSRYLAWFLQTTEYRNQVSALAAGMNINNLRASHIEELTIPLPSRPEQELIVALLDEQASRLDAGVESLKGAQANLKRYRASVLKAACEGRLVPTEAELARQSEPTPTNPNQPEPYESGSSLLARILEERRRTWAGKGKYKEPTAPDIANLPELPEGWTWATVDQLSALVTDGDHNPPKRTASGVPHLTAKNVQWSGLDFRGCTFISEQDAEKVWHRYRPSAGDLIVTCVGTVGRTAIITSDKAFSPDRNLAAVRMIEGLPVRYLNVVISGPNHQKHISSASGSTAQPHLYLGDLRSLVVPLPPLLEQERIVAEVERRLSVADALEATLTANLRRATSLRQAVLQRAFCFKEP